MREHIVSSGNSTMLCSKRRRELYLPCYYQSKVLKSVSGKDFMLEAIDVLKGVSCSHSLILSIAN